MIFMVCKTKKNHECKKAVEACKKCRKNFRCASFQEWSQPELRPLPVGLNGGQRAATSAGVAIFRENG